MSDPQTYRRLLIKLATDLEALEHRLAQHAADAPTVTRVAEIRGRVSAVAEQLTASPPGVPSRSDIDMLREGVRILEQDRMRIERVSRGAGLTTAFDTVLPSLRTALRHARMIVGLPGDDGTDF